MTCIALHSYFNLFNNCLIIAIINFSRSGSYQIRTSLPTEKQQTLLNHITPHSGVILEPSTAGQPPLQPVAPANVTATQEKKPSLSKVLKGVAASSISADSLSLSSPPGCQSPKDFEKLWGGNIPKEVSNLSEHLQNFIMGRVAQAKTAIRSRKIVIYICAADSQGKPFPVIFLGSVVP
ncbi:hypothetical protein NQ314_004550 [Rhamnusium bicolor]|uniref:Uncharacterized protein n=1 Tax=Rhamnusium bicolor TaxID=1586634 RepID=A0AAV8ZLW3_9CUCU|nr:hypothetical protein NQ314_004550 [Rhamnusium bicolor]